MKVQEMMERAGVTDTGRAVAYIKEGLREIQLHMNDNYSLGLLKNYTASTIGFGLGSTVITNGVDWTDATGTTQPTGWSIYESESLTDMGYSIDSGRLKILTNTTVSVTQRQGIYQSVSLVEGAKYKLSVNMTYNNLSLLLSIGEKAPTGSTVSSEMLDSYTNDNFSLTSTGVHTFDFTATSSTAYITIYAMAALSGVYSFIDDVSITPYQISDSANGLGHFSSGMKMRVIDSTSNDTDESSNASTGYYTAKSVAAGAITLDTAITTESAGNSIKLIGSDSSYIDLIKNKRFYDLPTDIIKMKNIRIKNHDNTSGKYKTIPRLTGNISEGDDDGI